MLKAITIPEDNKMRLEITADGVDANDFIYNKGDRVVFDGLLDNPQYNGMHCVIRECRPCEPSEYCPSGRAYYLTKPTPWGDDWVYEERLKPAPEINE